MSTLHGLRCNGCDQQLLFVRERGEKPPTKSVLEAFARSQGWNAPDKLGRHWCRQCRRPDGRKGARNA
jgi:hypothetical protein